jgi:hypothetical protein
MPLVLARWVPGKVGLRCAAPGCGLKIKSYNEEGVIQLTLENGRILHVKDENCLDAWENGHPEYEGARGPVTWEDQ